MLPLPRSTRGRYRVFRSVVGALDLPAALPAPRAIVRCSRYQHCAALNNGERTRVSKLGQTETCGLGTA